MKSKAHLLVSGLLCGSGIASAAEAPPEDVDTAPLFEARVEAGVGRTDNLFHSAAEEVDSTLYRVRPEVAARFRSTDSFVLLRYAGDYGRFQDSDDDDYNNHLVKLESTVGLARSVSIDVDAAIERGTEARGTGLTEGFDFVPNSFIDEPIEFDGAELEARLNFGADSASTRYAVFGGYREKTFRNFEDFTERRDKEFTTFGAGIYQRLGGTLSLLLEGQQRQIDYPNRDPFGGPKLDSKETSYLAGVTWSPTEKTTGTLKVGVLDKSFEAAQREDTSDVVWQLEFEWAPRTYSRFSVNGGRNSEETNGAGDFIDSTSIGARWEHDWNSRLSTTLAAEFLDEDYEADIREEEETTVSFRVGYKMTSNLTLGVSWAYMQRESNIERFEFDRNVGLVTLTYTL